MKKVHTLLKCKLEEKLPLSKKKKRLKKYEH